MNKNRFVHLRVNIVRIKVKTDTQSGQSEERGVRNRWQKWLQYFLKKDPNVSRISYPRERAQLSAPSVRRH